jgi:hypothetical protein
MKIEKTFTVAAPQARVWEFITTPDKVAPCIPGCEGAEQIDANKYKAIITTRVGPVKAKFHVEIETMEEQPPEFAKYMTKGEEGSKASRIKATSTLALKALSPASTEVTYTSDISIMGRLGKFGSGMMKKVADSVGDQFVAGLRESLEQESGAQSGAVPEKTPMNWKPIAIAISALLVIGLIYALSR